MVRLVQRSGERPTRADVSGKSATRPAAPRARGRTGALETPGCDTNRAGPPRFERLGGGVTARAASGWADEALAVDTRFDEHVGTVAASSITRCVSSPSERDHGTASPRGANERFRRIRVRLLGASESMRGSPT